MNDPNKRPDRDDETLRWYKAMVVVGIVLTVLTAIVVLILLIDRLTCIQGVVWWTAWCLPLAWRC